MKVSELITALQGHDPDLLVVVDGFDTFGFDGLKTLEHVHIVPVKKEDYGPDFEDPNARPGLITTGDPFTALYLHAGGVE